MEANKSESTYKTGSHKVKTEWSDKDASNTTQHEQQNTCNDKSNK